MAVTHPSYDTLIKKVGYKSSERSDLSDTTKPTAAEAAEWLTDGTYEILRLADPALIPEQISAPTSLSFVSGVVSLPADYLKIVAVYDDNREYVYADPRRFAVMATNTDEYLDTTTYSYTLINDSIYIGTSVSVSNPKIIYIKDLGSDISDGSSTTWPLALDLVPLVVDYAVIQSKMQEEEFQQYQLYMDWWYKRLAAMNANAIAHKETGEKND